MFFFGSGLHSCKEEHRIMYGNGTHDCWKLNKTFFFFVFYIFLYCVIFMLRGIIRMFWEIFSIVSNTQFAIKASI